TNHSARAADTGSIPVEQRNANAEVGGVVVVVDQALAVTLEQFRIAAQVAGEREAPAETGRAVLPAAAAERVAQGQTEFLAAPFVHDIDLAAARIIADVGVVVGASGSGMRHHGRNI